MLGSTTSTISTPGRSLRKMRVASVAVALSAALLMATAGSVFAWTPASFSPADEQLLFSLTNQDRASAGLNALVNDTYLHEEAEWRAQDMGDNNYFSHTIPSTGQMVFYSMQKDGYCFKVAGENIGLSTYGDDVATNRIEIAFMGSPTHRANILGAWARMGVGAYEAADGRKLYAVLFSVPCSVTVPKATAAPVTPPAPPKTPAPTAKPTAKPTLKPTAKPTLKPTAKPTATPTDTPAPTDTPTPSPTDTPTPSPTDTPTPSPTETPAPALLPSPISTSPSSPSPSASTGGPTDTTPTVDTVASLRVFEKTTSQGPLDSLFHSLFGGLFGW